MQHCTICADPSTTTETLSTSPIQVHEENIITTIPEGKYGLCYLLENNNSEFLIDLSFIFFFFFPF
jgi:hypothetical protein